MPVFTHRFLSFCLKLAFTLGAFWFALKDVDFAHLLPLIAGQDIAGVIAAGVLMLTQVFLGGLRWHRVLAALGNKLPLKVVEKLYYISTFFNCCLPGTVGGDVIRVWLAKSEHVPLPVAISSAVIDRMFALFALGLLVLFTLPLLGEAAGQSVAYWIYGILATSLIGLWLAVVIRRRLMVYQHLKPVQWLLHFLDGVHAMLNYKLMSLAALVYAILSHLNFCVAAYALAQSLNIELTLLQCITFFPLVMLAITLPISIGGWGVREASTVAILALAGVPQAAALMLSLELGFITIIVSLPAALLWMAYRKKIHR